MASAMARQSQSPLHRLLPLLAITALPLLAACGNSAGYPSLARRPAELLGTEGQALPRCPRPTEACPSPPARISGQAPVVAPSPVPAVSQPPATGSVQSRLAALVAEAQAADRSFLDQRDAAQHAADAAATAEAGSDAWARGTTALSELEAAHGATLTAQAGIDALNVADRIAHADAPADVESADAAAIRDAAARVGALLDAQNNVLATIRVRMHQ